MPQVIDEPQVSSAVLLKAAGRLSGREFERFANDIMTLRARRLAPSVPRNEARLLSRINQGLPPKLRNRMDELVSKRSSETLTEAELAELMRITGEVEIIELQRVKDLAALARLRKTDLRGVMTQLRIRAPDYA